MSDHEFVRTAADLATLDSAEIVEGYRDGFDGWPCGDNRSRSYRHGWLCARADKTGIVPAWLQSLVRDVAPRGVVVSK